jgi:hypothetical protein
VLWVATQEERKLPKRKEMSRAFAETASTPFSSREPCATIAVGWAGQAAGPSHVKEAQLLAEEMLECHECSAVCEKVVYPAACLSMNCRFLYSFQEDGKTYFGCIQKVFSHEVDLKRFQDIERTKGGFGVVKAARQPLPHCSVAVQSCYQTDEGLLCRNLYFKRRDRREVQTVED